MPGTTRANLKELLMLADRIEARELTEQVRRGSVDHSMRTSGRPVPSTLTTEEEDLRGFLASLPDEEVLRIEALYYFGASPVGDEESSEDETITDAYEGAKRRGVENARSGLAEKANALSKVLGIALKKLGKAKFDVDLTYTVDRIRLADVVKVQTPKTPK